MKCGVCYTDAVKNTANNQEFYFCPNCRVEVTSANGYAVYTPPPINSGPKKSSGYKDDGDNTSDKDDLNWLDQYLSYYTNKGYSYTTTQTGRCYLRCPGGELCSFLIKSAREFPDTVRMGLK